MYPLDNFLAALENFLSDNAAVTHILSRAYEAHHGLDTMPYLGLDGDDSSWHVQNRPAPDDDFRIVVEVPQLLERHYRLIEENRRTVADLLDMKALRAQFQERIRSAYTKRYGSGNTTSSVL